MNWQAFGAVSELVGSIAVVASLFYVGRQVAESSRAIKGQTFQSLSSQLNASSQLIMQDPSLQKIALKTFLGEELTQEELWKHHAVLLVLVRHLETAHYQYKLGLIELGKLNALISTASVNLASEAGRRFWDGKKSAHDADFVAFIDRLVDSVGDPKTRMAEFGLPKV